jgi:hypothetical protein
LTVYTPLACRLSADNVEQLTGIGRECPQDVIGADLSLGSETKLALRSMARIPPGPSLTEPQS